jgi:hypothetical protein
VHLEYKETTAVGLAFGWDRERSANYVVCCVTSSQLKRDKRYSVFVGLQFVAVKRLKSGFVIQSHKVVLQFVTVVVGLEANGENAICTSILKVRDSSWHFVKRDGSGSKVSIREATLAEQVDKEKTD